MPSVTPVVAPAADPVWPAAMPAGDPLTVTRWVRKNFGRRTTWWAAPAATLVDQLAAMPAGVDRLYLTAAPDADPVAWAGVLPPGWRASPRGHFLSTRALPVWRVVDPDGVTVEVHRAASWFGDDLAGDDDRPHAHGAMNLVGELLAGAFDPGARWLSTPAATGRDLFQRSIAKGREWPVLSTDLQEVIRSTGGQGRIEVLARGAGDLPALVQYDGRLAYSACCRELAAGVPAYDHEGDYAGHARARYHVTGRVPRDWTGPGLVGVPVEGGAGTGGKWAWPRDPGAPFDAWVDGAELAVIIDQRWEPRIWERLIWPDYRGKGPLDAWATKLVEVRTAIEARLAVGAVEARTGELARAAVRSIVLHSIGAFQGRGHPITHIGGEPPAGARSARLVDDDTGGAVWAWEEVGPPAWPEMAHPEWSAAVWARSRARLLRCPTGRGNPPAGMLTVDPSTLVACHTDAVWLTTDPRWVDDGAAGRLRSKGAVPGPLRAPRTMADIYRPRPGDGDGGVS